MQKYVAGFFLFSLLVSLSLESCVSHDFPKYVCADTYTFAADIMPIIETKCAISGCHNGDMGPELNWTNFQEFHKRVESGLVKYRVTNHIMPPAESQAGPLSEEQINAIACWSDQGALNN